MNCPKCHTAQPDAHRFCSVCGALIAPEESSTEALALHDLFDIARSLAATFDLDDLLKRIGASAERLTNAEASSILLVDESKRNLVFRVATGEKGQVVKKQLIPVGQGIAGWVAQHWKPLVVNSVAADPRFRSQVDQATGFVTRSILAVPMLVGGEIIGVCEVLNKRTGLFDALDESVLSSLAGFAALSIMNTRSAQDHRNFFAHTIELLTTATEAQDPRAKGHSVRVAHLSCAVARRMGVEGQDYKDLYYGALLHDVGMLALNDPHLVSQVASGMGERTAERLHPVLGADLLKGITMLKGVIPLVRHHHEFFDGSGHPDHLSGEVIPLGARIIGVVEQAEELRLAGLSGDALASRVESLLRSGSGTRFDPDVVEAYLAVTQELEALRAG